MKRAAVLVLAIMLVVAALPAEAQTRGHLQAKHGLVLVETTSQTGSGFVVSPGLVATACHVVKGAAAIQVHFWAAKVRGPARQVLCDDRYDIAFIAVAVPEGTAVLPFADVLPAQGESIWVWGYPLGTTIALEPSLTQGTVSATVTPSGFIALDVGAAPGSSGGPIVNADGKVVGIMLGTWVTAGSQAGTGFKYAAPSTVAAALMAQLPAPTAIQMVPEASSSLLVRPGAGIGGVQLGMSTAQVQDAVGLPPSGRDGSGWHAWNTRRLAVLFDQGVAVIIYTEDPAATTAEGMRVGATDTDLIKALGAPRCASFMTIEGRAALAWVYDGLILFVTGTPRRVAAMAVVPGGMAAAICR